MSESRLLYKLLILGTRCSFHIKERIGHSKSFLSSRYTRMILLGSAPGYVGFSREELGQWPNLIGQLQALVWPSSRRMGSTFMHKSCQRILQLTLCGQIKIMEDTLVTWHRLVRQRVESSLTWLTVLSTRPRRSSNGCLLPILISD